MTYDYSSESKRLELPNPYRLQNRLLWLCAALLVAAGMWCLWWARDSLAAETLRLAIAPLLAGLAMLASGLVAATTAARRLRFFFGRGRPASLAPEIPIGATGGSATADRVKEILRQGGLTYPEPQGAVEGLLYHWAPALITAPREVQFLARRYAFNLAAIAVTSISFTFSWLVFGTPATRPWIGFLYFAFALFFLLKPLLGNHRAGLTTASLVGLIASAILAPVLIGGIGRALPPLGGFSLDTQTFVMLLAALVACGLAMAAVLAQVDPAPQTRASALQLRLSMNAPPATLLDELDRTLQSEWTERIPNRRYARVDPVVHATTGSGGFSGELFDETQPMPMPGAKATGFAAALAEPRHRMLLLLDLYAVALIVVAIGMSLWFVKGFDAYADWRGGRLSLLGNSAILAFVAAFCLQSSARLWGRFNFESVLVWVEMTGTFQTSRIGTGNNFSSRMNTENDVVRTEAMTLRIWRARIESVVFGKDDARQVTAMFTTEKEAQALAAHLAEFAGAQSVFVAPSTHAASADAARLAALNAGEQALAGPSDAKAVRLPDALRPQPAITAGLSPRVHCSQCGTLAPEGARFCAKCGANLEGAA